MDAKTDLRNIVESKVCPMCNRELILATIDIGCKYCYGIYIVGRDIRVGNILIANTKRKL